MNGAAAAGAAAAAIAQAIKASGAIVQVEPSQFLSLLSKTQNPLVVTAVGGFFSTKHKYLTSYKGLIFYTKSPEALRLPNGVELFNAQSIWIPS